MNILSAPTNLGNRPYEDDGRGRQTTEGPGRLRDEGIVRRLAARDLGDVPAPGYRDFVRTPGTIRNEDLVLRHVREIAAVLEVHDGFSLVLGGDCSVLLGSMLGLARNRDLGLVYLDGHDDFNTTENTVTGAVAGMCLAMATGRGETELARLRGSRPLVRDEHVVASGIRDGSFRGARIRTAKSADEILEHFGPREFFVHVDADVLDPKYMPFVDSPEPGGLSPEELTQLLVPLVADKRAVGMEITIYDPRNDHERRGAAMLAEIVVETCRSRR